VRLRSSCIIKVAARVAIVFCLVSFPVAHAGVAVSPLQQEVSVQPGGESTFFIELTNVQRGFNPSREEVRLEVVDFAVSPEGAIAFGPETAHARSAKDWVRLDADRLVLEPGEAHQVKGEVSVPYGVGGDHWAAVMMTFGPPKTQPGVNVVLRTASGVFVRVVRQGYVVRPRIRSLKVVLPSFDALSEGTSQDEEEASLSLRVVVDVMNEGEFSFLGSGIVTFYLDGRRKVASVPLSAPRSRVLPGDSRFFEGVLGVPLQPGTYVARCVLAATDHPGRMGFAETEFTLTDELAGLWKSRSAEANPPGVKVEPSEMRLTTSAGRFTTLAIVVANSSPSTVSLGARLEHETIPDGWLQLDPSAFALAPGTRRSLVCRFAVPRGARPDEYAGRLLVDFERGGLIDEERNGCCEVPVFLTVRE